MVDRDRQLDHAEPGPEMAAVTETAPIVLLPQLVGELLKLLDREVAHVGGDMHPSSSGVLDMGQPFPDLSVKVIALNRA